MTVKEKPTTSYVVKVTGMSPELIALLDARVKEQHAAGRAEYVRELIRRMCCPNNRLRQFRRRNRKSWQSIMRSHPEGQTSSCRRRNRRGCTS